MNVSTKIRVTIFVFVGLIMCSSAVASTSFALMKPNLTMNNHTSDSIVIKNNSVTFGNGSVITGNNTVKANGEVVFRESCTAHKIEVTLPDGTTVCGWEDECSGTSYPVNC